MGDEVHGKKGLRGNLILKLLISGIVGLFLFFVAPDMLFAQEKGTPKMVLKEQLIDFKDVIEGKDISHSFQVFNEGDEPLKIEQVKPDCIRQLEIQLQSSTGNTIAQWQAATPQDQLLTYKYLFGIAAQDLTAPRDFSYITTPLPAGPFLSAGQKVRIWDNKVRDAAADDMIVRMQYAQRTV